MDFLPTVSVICICYNQGRWVEKALASVMNQTYSNLELIIVDDASSDDSRERITEFIEKHHFGTFIFNPENIGNCRSFNLALKNAKGRYIIDLAADDVLLPERIAKGVEMFENLPPEYAVQYTNAAFIDENDCITGFHYPIDHKGKSTQAIPEGNLYKILLEKYLVSPPTMMIRKEALDSLEGYDEGLTYEDFDFWLRSSRHYLYCYCDEVLLHKRMLKNSASNRQKMYKNPHTLSTAIVCEKALKMNVSEEENAALYRRLHYEVKWALYTENWEAAELMLSSMRKCRNDSGFLVGLYTLLLKIRLPYYKILRIFHK
ncbi:MAG: glycosyltransferase family 2 protein [Cyclobacteriaceae bacterium]|nr:glycosyltransferase family 2 protein [Cyclobacteriaceae bacterium]